MMFPIVERTLLAPSVVKMRILAPLIAKKALPGQFIILRVDHESERIPLTIADTDAQDGTVTIIFQTVGAGTMKLSALPRGQSIRDVAGPLGRPTDLAGITTAAVIGGGVGCAIAYPIAKKLHETGCRVYSILGFRSKSLVILEDEFRAVSDHLTIVTDDGSYGEKGLVTAPLSSLLAQVHSPDRVFAIGPLIMMKNVCLATKPFSVKTVVSMNPIMIDGTGMCGGCRLTVGGETKFACVDGPDFDGHLVDFDETISRNSMYQAQEARARQAACQLFQEVR